jgi:NAD-dependent SIR2 family protein deacetylase
MGDPLDAGREALRRFVAAHRRVFALTGAGCSTASGIPTTATPRASGSAGRP